MSTRTAPSESPRLWRRLLALDLGIFNLAMVALALIPPNTLVVPELVVSALGALLFFGVLSHASDTISVPGEQWAYLATGTLGLWTFLNFEVGASGGEVQLFAKVSIGLFLLSGAASGYAAHVIDGGRRRGQRT